MPPKRKAGGTNNAPIPLVAPDRNNWPGWVEFESEPELFDILLKDMGVRGLSIRELTGVYDGSMKMIP